VSSSTCQSNYARPGGSGFGPTSNDQDVSCKEAKARQLRNNHMFSVKKHTAKSLVRRPGGSRQRAHIKRPGHVLQRTKGVKVTKQPHVHCGAAHGKVTSHRA
jgi:hypothetical protein